MAEARTVTVRFQELRIIHDGDRFGPGEIYIRFGINDGEDFFEGRIPEEGFWKLNDGDVRTLEGPEVTFADALRDINILFEVFDRDVTADEPLGEQAAYVTHRYADGYRPGRHEFKTKDYVLTYTVEVK